MPGMVRKYWPSSSESRSLYGEFIFVPKAFEFVTTINQGETSDFRQDFFNHDLVLFRLERARGINAAPAGRELT